MVYCAGVLIDLPVGIVYNQITAVVLLASLPDCNGETLHMTHVKYS